MNPERFAGILSNPTSFPCFKDLVNRIRHHLTHSTSTRTKYLHILHQTHQTLPQNSLTPIPNDSDILNVFNHHWPIFNSPRRVLPKDVVWGYVSTAGNQVPDEINIWDEVVTKAEIAATNPHHYAISQYHFHILITAIVLHELAHLLIRRLLGVRVKTPEQVEDGKFRKGESGFAVEKLIFGGVIEAEWSDGTQYPMLDQLNVLVMCQASQAFEICEASAKLFVESLGEDTLRVPVGHWARPVSLGTPPGARRARTAGQESANTSIGPTIGLGLGLELNPPVASIRVSLGGNCIR